MSTPDPRDLGIALPSSWRRSSDPERGVLVSARSASVPASGFRPEVVLRRDRPSVPDLARRLRDFALGHDDELELHGQAVTYRRFAHRVGDVDVVCDQWEWPGVTLTCSVAREDYWDYCDVFEAVAATVDVGPRA